MGKLKQSKIIQPVAQSNKRPPPPPLDVDYHNEEEMYIRELTGGIYSHIAVYFFFFVGIICTFYLILFETNKLIWNEDLQVYRVKYINLNNMLPNYIRDIPYPTKYNMFKVLTNASDPTEQMFQMVTNEQEEMWYIISVPSIEQATFLVAPLAQELYNYANFQKNLRTDGKKVLIQCLTFNFTQQSTQMIPEYLKIQGKYVASVINYLRKEVIIPKYRDNYKFIIFSHWSGSLVTYRALQLLYNIGEYQIDDFFLFNYDPLFFGGPSMINDRQLQTLYEVTRASEVFNNQRNVLTLFSSEESNLIVDQNLGLDDSKQDEQYFVQKLFKEGDMSYQYHTESIYIKEFVQALVPHIYRTLEAKENAQVANRRLQFRPFDEIGVFNKSGLVKEEKDCQQLVENFQWMKTNCYRIEVQEEGKYLLIGNVMPLRKLEITKNNEEQLQEPHYKHTLYHQQLGQMIIAQFDLQEHDRLQLNFLSDMNYRKEHGLQEFKKQTTQLDHYVEFIQLNETTQSHQQFSYLSMLLFQSFTLDQGKSVHYFDITNWYMPFQICLKLKPSKQFNTTIFMQVSKLANLTRSILIPSRSTLECYNVHNYDFAHTRVTIAGASKIIDQLVDKVQIKPLPLSLIVNWVHTQHSFILTHVIAIQFLLTYLYLEKSYPGEEEKLTLPRIILFNYKLIALCIFISVSLNYYCPYFVTTFGFLGYDLPIPKPFHSNPYFFVLWVLSLMTSCTFHLVFHFLATNFITIMRFLGSMYFNVCSFILCGSRFLEIGFVLFLLGFISYSALNNLVIILVFMHVMILLYRGRPTQQPSLSTTNSVSKFHMLAFTHLLLLIDYAVYEQNLFNDTGMLRIVTQLSQFHHSILYAQHLCGIVFCFLTEDDIAQVFQKCKYLVLATALYQFLFGVGWLYRTRISITYLLMAIEAVCMLKVYHKVYLWVKEALQKRQSRKIKTK